MLTALWDWMKSTARLAVETGKASFATPMRSVLVLGFLAGVIGGCLTISAIRRDQPPAHLMGWAGPEAAERAWAKYGHLFPKFAIKNPQQDSEGKIAKLWLPIPKVLKGQKFLEHNQQLIGDCVGFGGANAIEYCQIGQIGILGQNFEFKPIFPCYTYACGRNATYAGNGAMGRDPDGSTGTWQALAAVHDGATPEDAPGIPKYSESVARQWAVRMPAQQFLDIGRKHLTKTTARLYGYADVRDSIVNTYPCTIASNRGFKMQGKADQGKLWGIPSGSWAHQMCFIGVDDTVQCPSWAGGGKGACYILNNWGEDAHGAPVDDAPPGGFWVASKIVDQMCQSGECFAYSGFDGFPGQAIDWDLLDKLDQVNRAAGPLVAPLAQTSKDDRPCLTASYSLSP